MAGLSERRARILASVYRTFGEAATWTPVAGGSAVPATVRRVVGEAVLNWGESEAVVPTLTLRVRVSEVASPSEGDLVTFGADLIRLIAEPRLEPLGLEWLCEAKASAT
ncbi:hypothetical protein [uncultured Brevundimonas sp.]|uniref:head-tail joining protein n=1 Tax=uncultured Brevundimonas sp. TaxID=213418 RepID=UPI0025E63D3B|nr:hypothetical protein [uncultured Brevundimonas sp.]